MKSYNEIANSVFERRDKHIATQKRKKRRFFRRFTMQIIRLRFPSCDIRSERRHNPRGAQA